ncbi:MAG: hypothetical protein M9891_06145 [Austwickia sp.]|nr:hypothetical protein [Actinomycetota bacterium]MCO5308860.1 hypothetical protein [Austwickia sp.]
MDRGGQRRPGGARLRSLVHQLANSEDELRRSTEDDPLRRGRILRHQQELIAQLRTDRPS